MNTNPNAHKQAALNIIRVPYIVASLLKILIPVGTTMIPVGTAMITVGTAMITVADVT